MQYCHSSSFVVILYLVSVCVLNGSITYRIPKGQLQAKVKHNHLRHCRHKTTWQWTLKEINYDPTFRFVGCCVQHLDHFKRSWSTSRERLWAPSAICRTWKTNETGGDSLSAALIQGITSDGIWHPTLGCFNMCTLIHRHMCTQSTRTSRASYVMAGTVQWKSLLGPTWA